MPEDRDVLAPVKRLFPPIPNLPPAPPEIELGSLPDNELRARLAQLDARLKFTPEYSMASALSPEEQDQYGRISAELARREGRKTQSTGQRFAQIDEAVAEYERTGGARGMSPKDGDALKQEIIRGDGGGSVAGAASMLNAQIAAAMKLFELGEYDADRVREAIKSETDRFKLVVGKMTAEQGSQRQRVQDEMDAWDKYTGGKLQVAKEASDMFKSILPRMVSSGAPIPVASATTELLKQYGINLPPVSVTPSQVPYTDPNAALADYRSAVEQVPDFISRMPPPLQLPEVPEAGTIPENPYLKRTRGFLEALAPA